MIQNDLGRPDVPPRGSWVRAVLILVLGLTCSWGHGALAAVEVEAGGIPAGPGVYREGRWGTVRTVLSNTGAVDEDRLVLYREPGQVGVQFGNRAWLPPSAILRIDTPVQWNGSDDAGSSMEIETLVVQGSQGAESASAASPSLLMRANRSEKVLGLLVELLDRGVSGMLRGFDSPSGNRGLRVTRIATNDPAPYANPWAWDILDAVTIASDSVTLGPAQTQAMRQWVVRGGRVWLMLDSSSADWGRALAGDAWTLAEVGQTTLTQVPTDGLGGTKGTKDPSFAMRRVLLPGAETVFELDGYPVLMELPIGRGKLLVSTVPFEAWQDEAGMPGPWLKELKKRLMPEGSMTAARAMRVRDAPDVTGAMTAFSDAQVGYAVPNRWTVIALMGLFVAALTGSGLWLMSSGKTERFAVIGVGLAFVMAGVLLVIGWTKQSAAPQTLAQMQVVRYADQQPVVEETASLSAYSPVGGGSSPAQLRGQGNVPDIASAAQLQGAKRLVWLDTDSWAFEVLSLPPGAVHNLGVTGVSMLPAPVSATLELGQAGLTGRYDAQTVGTLQDAMLLTADHRYGVSIEADGRFVVQDQRPLRAGELRLGGAMLTSEQIDRLAVTESVAVSERPQRTAQLLGWTTGEPMDVSLSDTAENREQTLAILPVEVARPEAGTQVTVPSALIYFAPSRSGRTASAYDPEARQWLPDISVSLDAQLRFTLPSNLLPLSIERASLTLDIHAPQRTVTVKGRGGREVFTQESLSGITTIELTAQDLPPLDADGGLTLTLSISDTAEFSAIPPTWTIRDLGLSVEGTTGAQP